MLPPQSFSKFSCSQCNWTKTMKPKSDVRFEGFDHFTKCPRCHESVTEEYAPHQFCISLWSFFKDRFSAK